LKAIRNRKGEPSEKDNGKNSEARFYLKKRRKKEMNKKEVRCKACGGKIRIGACATECLDCGASVSPITGEPFTYSSGGVVKCSDFGGTDLNRPKAVDN